MRSLPASGQGPGAAGVEFAQLLPRSRDLENRSATFSPRSSPKASQDTKSVPINAVSVQAASQKKAIFGSLLSGVKVEKRERGTSQRVPSRPVLRTGKVLAANLNKEKTKKLKRSHQNSCHVGVINPMGDFFSAPHIRGLLRPSQDNEIQS
ncbi:uncharacterized protein LOC105379199 [Homo sapiens]|uniref:uncharacterized protein LOC105379199 n=1 Tax=Homo sapiens TaxID=9606 RepID=UPI001FB0A6BD|nr:uncharacterized protein LOC105379199 [Homo sapiens]XP_047300518.1 uncharacterized protein LOC105379199 [Homo sapiens]